MVSCGLGAAWEEWPQHTWAQGGHLGHLTIVPSTARDHRALQVGPEAQQSSPRPESQLSPAGYEAWGVRHPGQFSRALGLQEGGRRPRPGLRWKVTRTASPQQRVPVSHLNVSEGWMSSEGIRP